jgi:hypothetical protein
MGAAQLGTLNVGAELATGPTPSQSITKDRNFWNISLSSVGVSDPPQWNKYNVWGAANSIVASTARPIGPNAILTIPHWFNRTGFLETVTIYVTTGGGDVNTTLGLYANNADGEVYPGIRVAQSTQIVVPGGSTGFKITWNPHHPIVAGSMFFLAIGVGLDQLSFDFGSSCANFHGVMGTVGTEGDPGVGADTGFETVCGIETTTVYGVGANRLPAVFPVSDPIFQYAPSSGSARGTLPCFAFRFAKP